MLRPLAWLVVVLVVLFVIGTLLADSPTDTTVGQQATATTAAPATTTTTKPPTTTTRPPTTATTSLCQQSPFTSRELLMLNELSGAGRLVALPKGIDDDGDGVAESDWCSARAESILTAGVETLDVARRFCEAIGEAMREAGVTADEAAEIILQTGNAGADERRFVGAMRSSFLCSNGQYTPGAYPG